MSDTRGWTLEDEKAEYQLDGLVLSGAMSEREAQMQLPGYNAPGHFGCSCAQREAEVECSQQAERARTVAYGPCP